MRSPSGSKANEDYLYRNSITTRFHRQELTFDIAEGLFSTSGIDAGTAYLLRWLAAEPLADDSRILDMGSGYGPIGISLARLHPTATVLGVDRDALAVEYTNRNAQLNGVGDRVDAVAALGFDALGTANIGFDLVVSNVPAKVGTHGIEHFVFGSEPLLAPDGTVALVVVDRLREQVTRLLADHAVEPLAAHANKAYQVFRYRPPAGSAPTTPVAAHRFDRGPHRRFSAVGRNWTVQPTYTLPEFDTLTFATQHAMTLLAGLSPRNPLTVIGTGVGHLAAFACAGDHDRSIALVDRDLLALQASHRAVQLTADGADTNITLHHAPRVDVERSPKDCVALRVSEKEPVPISTEVVRRLLDTTPQGGTVLLYGRNADLSRILELLSRKGLPVRVLNEVRSKGSGAVTIRPR